MAIHKADGVDGQNNFVVKKVLLYAAAAVAVGDCVMIDIADTTNGLGNSIKVSDAANSPLAFGVALTAVGASGGYVQVQTSGPCVNLVTANGVIATLKMIGSNVAGDVSECGAAIDEDNWAFAVCVEAFTAGNADGTMLIIDKGWFSS